MSTKGPDTPGKGILSRLKRFGSSRNSTRSSSKSTSSAPKPLNIDDNEPTPMDDTPPTPDTATTPNRRLSLAADGTWFWECTDGETSMTPQKGPFINFEAKRTRNTRYNGSPITKTSAGEHVGFHAGSTGPVRSVSQYNRRRSTRTSMSSTHSSSRSSNTPSKPPPAYGAGIPFSRFDSITREAREARIETANVEMAQSPQPDFSTSSKSTRKFSNRFNWDYTEVAPQGKAPAWDCRDMPRMQILWYVKMICAHGEIGSFIIRLKKDGTGLALTLKTNNDGDLITFLIEVSRNKLYRIKGTPNCREFRNIESLIDYYAEKKRAAIGIQLVKPTALWLDECSRRACMGPAKASARLKDSEDSYVQPTGKKRRSDTGSIPMPMTPTTPMPETPTTDATPLPPLPMIPQDDDSDAGYEVIPDDYEHINAPLSRVNGMASIEAYDTTVKRRNPNTLSAPLDVIEEIRKSATPRPGETEF